MAGTLRKKDIQDDKMNQPHGTHFHITEDTISEVVAYKHSQSKKESVQKNGKRFGGGPYILVARFAENLLKFAGFELEGFVVGSITLKLNAQQRQPLQDRSQVEVRPDATMAKTVRHAVQSIRLESAHLFRIINPPRGEVGHRAPKTASHPPNAMQRIQHKIR
jgi:hypothetical protein